MPIRARAAHLSFLHVTTQCAHHEQLRILPWDASVEDVIAAWPADRPIAALVSGGASPQWSRWSILSTPVQTITTVEETARALSARPRSGIAAKVNDPPFRAGWIGWVGYEAGERIEPVVKRDAPLRPDDRSWPDVCLHRCEGAYVFDHAKRQWWATGDAASLPAIDPQSNRDEGGDVRIGELTSGTTQQEYEQNVRRVLEYIRSGDIFQANISRRISGALAGSPRELFIAMLDGMAPWFGALIEGPTSGRAVISASPELFLRVTAGDGRILTRPIKGTAPGDAAVASLSSSEKDQSELAMIVDLMRNDIGRVSEFGSVRVPEPRAIEPHGSTTGAGVWHGVATVEGQARQEVSLWDIVSATFPPGSITGAPKVRAMQIIREIEQTTRGPYCGSVGWFDDAGSCELNVAIRTASITGEADKRDWTSVDGVIDYHVGAGIVADSVPTEEWRETEVKAAGFLKTVVSLRSIPSGAAS